MSASIRSIPDFQEAAEKAAQLILEEKELSTRQASLISKTKADFSEGIDGRKKEISSLKKKLATWLRKKADQIFDGSETGTWKSNQVEIAWARNPPKLEQTDKDQTDDELVNKALELGFDHIVRTAHTIDKEALEKLSDEDLLKIGFIRKHSKRLTIKPLAAPEARENQKVAD